MKTMTCTQLGGPCAMAIQGNTADEVIKSGEKHIREMVANGDESHKGAMQMMDDMRKNPQSGMEWYQKTQSDFAALPEDK
jgi:predicted small metal-binding protein